jgi:hypothetical protein
MWLSGSFQLTGKRATATLAMATALGTLIVSGAALTPSSAIAAETCQGRAATIVPSGSGMILGTEGPDVIVAADGRDVDARGGDDLICLFASGSQVSMASGGDGDDTVDATAVDASTLGGTFVLLGMGADTYLGGDGVEVVYGGASDGIIPGVPAAADTERDVISTGAGVDDVVSGAPGAANPDAIITGRGDDRLSLDEVPAGLDVGKGSNSVQLHLSGSTWRVDAANRTISSRDSSWSWSGQVERWGFSSSADGDATMDLEFLGSAADEYVFTDGSNLIASLHLRGGNDVASVAKPTFDGTYELGSGRDQLALLGPYYPGVPPSLDRLRIDLSAGQIDVGADGTAGRVSGVEQLSAAAPWLRIVGAGRSERIQVEGCDVTVRGGGGADWLRSIGEQLTGCLDGESNSTKLLGGPGRDWLIGSKWVDDVLLGGPGRDYARGSAGTDTCRAETERKCERD